MYMYTSYSAHVMHTDIYTGYYIIYILYDCICTFNFDITSVTDNRLIKSAAIRKPLQCYVVYIDSIAGKYYQVFEDTGSSTQKKIKRLSISEFPESQSFNFSFFRFLAISRILLVRYSIVNKK